MFKRRVWTAVTMREIQTNDGGDEAFQKVRERWERGEPCCCVDGLVKIHLIAFCALPLARFDDWVDGWRSWENNCCGDEWEWCRFAVYYDTRSYWRDLQRVRRLFEMQQCWGGCLSLLRGGVFLECHPYFFDRILLPLPLYEYKNNM